ncbi:MAG: ATP-binding protein [Eubacterium sp.]|nr:ATP-binding protein [Eubacterium sp.]
MTNADYQQIFHEIKNYITFINSSLQLVEKMHPEIREYPYWHNSMQELDSLKRMLLELNSARLNTELCLESISLDTFLADLVNSCTAAFHSEEFQIKTDISSQLPKLSADPERLKRALSNLIKNAYEAMSGKGTVLMSASLEQDYIRLDITDFGGGIPEDYLPELFTPFKTTKQGGTGLGLLIARQIIETHKGHILVDSRPKDGCTFSVCLPAH